MIPLNWPDFRKLLDGTFESLNHLPVDMGSWYSLYAESWGGLQATCRIDKTTPPNPDQIDYETHFKNKAPTARRTSDGLPRQAAEKPTDPKANAFSVNLCDKTTWFAGAARVVDESLTIALGAATLAHPFAIDLTHGKVTNEDNLVATHGLVVKDGEGATLKERDMHYQNLVLLGKLPPSDEPAYDYEVDYAASVIIFHGTPPASATATYSYAQSSVTVVTPPPGQDLQVVSVEVNFSDDVDMLDTVVFQAYVYNPDDLPNKVAYGLPIKYKTVRNLNDEANGAQPEQPAISSPTNMRGTGGKKTRVLQWSYATKTPLSSAVGAELRLSLEHDYPFDGSYATITFYGVLKPTPNLAMSIDRGGSSLGPPSRGIPLREGCLPPGPHVDLAAATKMLDRVFKAMKDDVVRRAGFDNIKHLRLSVDPKIRDRDRHFAACSTDGNLLVLAPDMAILPAPTLMGILQHEFGHAIDFSYPGQFHMTPEGIKRLRVGTKRNQGVPKDMMLHWDSRSDDTIERTADAIAEGVFGVRIGYCGPCMLQTLLTGAPGEESCKRPRPSGLR